MSGIASREVKALNNYTAKNGERKTSYTTIGVAFENNDGSILIKLKALPLPNLYNGQVECTLKIEPVGGSEYLKKQIKAQVKPEPFADDQEIPF